MKKQADPYMGTIPGAVPVVMLRLEIKGKKKEGKKFSYLHLTFQWQKAVIVSDPNTRDFPFKFVQKFLV